MTLTKHCWLKRYLTHKLPESWIVGLPVEVTGKPDHAPEGSRGVVIAAIDRVRVRVQLDTDVHGQPTDEVVEVRSGDLSVTGGYTEGHPK